jgi:hypothetical protein
MCPVELPVPHSRTGGNLEQGYRATLRQFVPWPGLHCCRTARLLVESSMGHPD